MNILEVEEDDKERNRGAAGRQIESVIGDMAYSEKKNIEAAKEGDYELIEK